MACPKLRVTYPDTSTLIERPFGVIVRQIDPDYDKVRRYDVAYEFGGLAHRKFLEDSILHGAYARIDLTAAQSGLPGSGIDLDAIVLTRGLQDGAGGASDFSPNFPSDFSSDVSTIYLAAIAAQFQRDNGFCDPIDDGTVFTGTGGGGSNPGAVPSVGADVGYVVDGGSLNLSTEYPTAVQRYTSGTFTSDFSSDEG